jgi:hypothetical protein
MNNVCGLHVICVSYNICIRNLWAVVVRSALYPGAGRRFRPLPAVAGRFRP